MELRVRFYRIVTEYIKAFLKKQELEIDLDDVWWVADDVGGVCNINEHYLQFDDIRLDVDMGIEKGKIFDWYDDSMIAHQEEKYNVNYKTYLMNNPTT